MLTRVSNRANGDAEEDVVLSEAILGETIEEIDTIPGGFEWIEKLDPEKRQRLDEIPFIEFCHDIRQVEGFASGFMTGVIGSPMSETIIKSHDHWGRIEGISTIEHQIILAYLRWKNDSTADSLSEMISYITSAVDNAEEIDRTDHDNYLSSVIQHNGFLNQDNYEDLRECVAAVLIYNGSDR